MKFRQKERLILTLTQIKGRKQAFKRHKSGIRVLAGQEN